MVKIKVQLCDHGGHYYLVKSKNVVSWNPSKVSNIQTLKRTESIHHFYREQLIKVKVISLQRLMKRYTSNR